MKKWLQFAAAITVVLTSVSTFAEDAGGTPRSTAWTWSAYITVPLFALALLYVLGLLRMRRRGVQLRWFPILCFASGWLSLFLALDSPVHEISEQLFWVHMTQHEILMLISAPLLILSQPAAPLLFALPERWRVPVANIGKAKVIERSWLLVSAPVAAWLLHAAALWVWHAPKLFDATLESEWVHAAQHISFLGTALLFWWTLFHKHAGRLGYGGAILYVFTTAVHTSVLGALLTFAPHAWYAPYAQTAQLWGLTALQDQQIGGLIMWIPAGTLLTIVALVLLSKWMSHSDTRWEYTRAAALIRASQGAAE
ncbi:MAG TPA: cytochrome c oxidase assembly protein [Terriglobales bacterium]|jgi:putative membrane protein|nr:cytochrome c oxidase assembly protein [Terriglobales bacterium]